MTGVKQVVRVLPGHRVEVVAPELPEGELVDVIVMARSQAGRAVPSALAFVDSLPDGPRAFPSWEAYEQHLQEEKKSWDR